MATLVPLSNFERFEQSTFLLSYSQVRSLDVDILAGHVPGSCKRELYDVTKGIGSSRPKRQK